MTVKVHVPKTEGAAARTRRLRSVICRADCCADEHADARAAADALDLSRLVRTLARLAKTPGAPTFTF
jgi:hypothetical protein